MRYPISKPQGAAVGLAVLLVACTGPGAGGGLIDTAWSLNTIAGQPVAAPASLLLRDGRATGNTGCNPFSGSARISGNDIAFGPMITTKMACLPQAKMDQEAALLAAFAATTHWRIDGGALVLTLVLSDGRGQDRLRFSQP
jgi:heat shock protein HslJ